MYVLHADSSLEGQIDVTNHAQHILTGSTSGDAFGQALTMASTSGEAAFRSTLVVGAPGVNDGDGAVFWFDGEFLDLR